ncbi:MAG TPA: hypothetical protein VFP37_18170, partial [Steroidobacteraceae bacterium]|nr:hypothetical protein [Steroidobacteraceae bacterium]
MKRIHWLTMTAALALPLAAWCEEPAPEAPVRAESSATKDASTFSLRAAAVQKIVRDHAAKVAPESAPAESPSIHGREFKLQFRGERRVDRFDCDAVNCIARNAAGEDLYSIPRDQYYGITDDSANTWLSCQSGNDLLSTFERYDHCRG